MDGNTQVSNYRAPFAAFLAGAASPTVQEERASTRTLAADREAQSARALLGLFRAAGVFAHLPDFDAESVVQRLASQNAPDGDYIQQWAEASQREELGRRSAKWMISAASSGVTGALENLLEMTKLRGRFRVVSAVGHQIVLQSGRLQFAVDVSQDLDRLVTVFNVQLALLGRGERVFVLATAEPKRFYALLDQNSLATQKLLEREALVAVR